MAEPFGKTVEVHVDASRMRALAELSYRQGYIDALSNYAIWNDGVQYVGALRRPLKEVIAEFDKQEIPVRY